MKRLSKHLKAGGILVVSVPSANKPVSPKHFQHFTKESLEKTLQPYFSISEIEGYGLIGRERRLVLLKKMAMVLYPFRKKAGAVNRLVDYLPKYYEKNIARAGIKDCTGYIAVCRKSK